MATTLSIISNTRVRLDTTDPKVRAFLDKTLSFEHEGYQFTRQYRNWKRSGGKYGWDGKTHFLTVGSNTFPIGLLDRAVAALRDSNTLHEVRECRIGPSARSLVERLGPPFPWSRPSKRGAKPINEVRSFSAASLEAALAAILPGKILRPDQVQSILTCVNKERGIVWAATGSGKTEVAIGLSKLLTHARLNGRILFLSGGAKLLRDTRKRFMDVFGADVGFISEGQFDSEHPVVIASVDTLQPKKRKGTVNEVRKKQTARFLKTVSVLIVDECHKTASASWYRLITRVPARVRIGLSGTPLDRGDGKNLLTVAALGEVIQEVRLRELSKAGVVARPTVTVIPCRHPTELEEADYEQAYAEGIVSNLWRNARIARETPKGEATLVLVQHLVHGRNLQAAYRLHGRKVAFVHGQMSADLLDRETQRFKEGRTDVLIASAIFRQGIDIPRVDNVVIGDAGKSVVKILQQIGRGTRKKQGANTVKVLDFADLSNGYLAQHSQKRIAIYRREGFEIQFDKE